MRRAQSRARRQVQLPPDSGSAVAALAERFSLPLDAMSGWEIARNITRHGYTVFDPGLREYAMGLAVEAVLERAAALCGPLRASTRTVAKVLREPHAGDFDVERTLENIVGKEFPERDDWMVERREERRQQIVLMMDTSLSMAGPNLAVAAVAAAVMALKLHPQDLALVAFESKAECLKRLEEPDPPEELVRRMLDQPCAGYTNIEAALELGVAELERGRNPRRAGLLITDGVDTSGGDPLKAAPRFSRLYVMLTEDYKMNPELCYEMARAGGGDVFPVASFDDLPRRMLDVANIVLR